MWKTVCCAFPHEIATRARQARGTVTVTAGPAPPRTTIPHFAKYVHGFDSVGVVWGTNGPGADTASSTSRAR